MADAPALHPDCSALSPLLGTWRGEGRGHYPTIDDFTYVEELTFAHVGKPFLVMTQRTRHGDTGEPLHTETGYLRPRPDGGVELTLAQPTGVVEVAEGPLTVTPTGLHLVLSSRLVGLTSSAKRVDDVVRHLRLDGGELTSELWMAAVGQPFGHHLTAVLARV